jgi:hypothetical protein
VLNLTKDQNKPVEAENSNHVVQAEEAIHQIRSSSTTASEISSISVQFDQIQKQLQGVDDNRKARQEKKAEQQKFLQEAETVSKTMEEFRVKVGAAKEKSEVQSKALVESQALETVALEQKVENDKVETTDVLSGKTEQALLFEEKEKLARSISESHEKRTVNNEQCQETLKESSETHDKHIKPKLVETDEEREGLRVKVGNRIRIRDEAKENWESEIKEHKSRDSQFLQAVEAENARVQETRKTLAEDSKSRLDQAESKAARRGAELDRCLQMLIWGDEIVEEAKTQERHVVAQYKNY